MKKIKQYIKLLKPKHYIKNLLIFLPILFSCQIDNKQKLLGSILGFISFCFLASGIYIINDIKDADKDRIHPVKKDRPIASNKVTVKSAIILLCFLIFCSVLMNVILYLTNNISINSFVLLNMIEASYLVINICYSFGLKNLPIIDIALLVSGYVLRLLYGSIITDIAVSNWLYLTIMSGAFFIAFGKRRNEIIYQGDRTRESLKAYNKDFLDKFMYVCLIITIVFYSLWCIDNTTVQRLNNNLMIWTIPLLLLVVMKYCLNLETNSLEDPVDIIFKDKILVLLIMLFIIFTIVLLYLI